MRKSWLALVLLCLVVACKPETRIVEELGHIRISSGNHEVLAAETGTVDASFMVVGAHPIMNHDTYEDGALSLIPLETANALHRRYGHFMRCQSAGSAAAKRQVTDFIIIATNSGARDAVRGLKRDRDRMHARGKLEFPIIRIRGQVIEISRATYKNTPVIFQGRRPATILADAIEMELQDYAF